MRIRLLILLMFSLAIGSGVAATAANHVILTGGPALRKWENYRVKRDQHDRWWANFIRASTLRMVEIRRAYGPDAKITWVVYRDSYAARATEDGKPYTQWINDLAAKRHVTLRWVHSGSEAISAINNHPSKSVMTFDYFGHSNKYCFLLDYSSKISGASKAWIHQNDLSKIRRGIFSRNSQCQSWGCHTGESMSAVWKRNTGKTLIGVHGKTDYSVVGHGRMPAVVGNWVR
jgi:hypothetical protein